MEKRRRLTIFSLSAGLVGALSLAGLAGWQWRQTEIAKSNAISKSSDVLFSQGKEFDALIESLRAGVTLRHIKAKPAMDVVNTLRQAVYGVRERNRLEGHSDLVTSVSFSPDGKTLASGSTDKTIKIWDIATGKAITTLTEHSDLVTTISFSPDGKTLASGSRDKTIKIWNIETGNTTLTEHNAEVSGISFSPDGKTIASGSGDGTIILWNFDFDNLLVRGCNWVRPYLLNNINVSESNRHLCDGI